MLVEPRAEAMSADQRAAEQTDRLRSLVHRLLDLGGRQARQLRQAGVDSAAGLTLTDLPALPVTDKRDLWEEYPFGMLAVPRQQVPAVHGSSGTGGRPTLVGYTHDDLTLWARMCARSLGCAGARPDSLVHNAYGYGLFTGGMGIHLGALQLGATVVPASGGLTARQVTLIRDLRPDVLTCTPSYAVHLAEALAEAGVDVGSLRVGVFGAEPWTTGLRNRIESLLPLTAVDIYGLSEVIGPGVATECLEARDGLHVNEDQFLVEAVDPGTGGPVPEGTLGELVFTTLTKQALPLLRYRTGDLASLRGGGCACGRTLVRMSQVVGRRDDMLVVRGVNVYPSEVEAVLLADRRVRPHYQLVVDRRGPMHRLLVVCEVDDDRETCAAALAATLSDRLAVHAEVSALAPGTLPRQETGKAVRVVSWDDGPAPLPGLDEPRG